jgi:diguanylate cyclase (GGDEF)-like protein
MTISAALLEQGLVLARPGLTGALFLLALIEPRPRRYLRAAFVPAALFAALGAFVLPRRLFADGVLLYGLSLLLACGVAFVVGGLRRRAFLAEKALTHAARYDSLTGALARGYLAELANHDVALARRHGRPLAVAMLDIDYFKRINDTHGHATGDRVLAALAGACRKAMRASDYLGRIGGEEFVCVMPETKREDAIACAERIRLGVAAMSVPANAGPLRVTVSIGVAAFGGSGGDWDTLLAAADAALYRAKGSGRNRTVADDTIAE